MCYVSCFCINGIYSCYFYLFPVFSLNYFYLILRGNFYYCLCCVCYFRSSYSFCYFSCFRIYFVRCRYFSCSFFSRNSNTILSFFSRTIFFVSYRTWYFCNFYFILRGNFYYCLCCVCYFRSSYSFCYFSCFRIYFVRCRYFSCSFFSRNSNTILSFFSRTIFFVSYRTWYFCNFYFILRPYFNYLINSWFFSFFI